MGNIKQELADVIRSKTNDELIAMVLEREPATIVTKPIVSHRFRDASRKTSVLGVLEKRGPCTTAEIANDLGLSGGEAKRTIGQLKDEGRIFQGGNRKYTRYAMTQKEADDASERARGKP